MNKITSNVRSKRNRRDRKEEILKVAQPIFAKYGFQGASTAKVAEAVGLTEQGVLHYFPSKVHLLQGVLEYHEQKELDKYTDLIEVEKSSVQELFELLGQINKENEKIPGLIQLFTVLVSESIRSDHPSHAYFVDRYRRAREMYINLFFKLGKTKIREDVNPGELTALIMAVMDGLQIQWLLDPKKVNMKASFNLFSKIVVEFLEK